jgi:UDP-glucose 4-epimerase
MEKPEAAGKVFNVSDGTFHTVHDIILSICEALGRRPPRICLPVGMVRMAAGITEDLARLVGLRSPVGRAIFEKYTEDIAVDGGRICRELGFNPKYDLAAGWRETVTDMRMRGQL